MAFTSREREKREALAKRLDEIVSDSRTSSSTSESGSAQSSTQTQTSTSPTGRGSRAS